jgi:ribonucleotide monophosphatase NagD (HAD superfamily)
VAIDVIEGADQALRRVMTKSFDGAKIPFAFMTNGGMETEQQKADKMNALLKFTPEEGRITKENVFLCHTIFGSP